METVNGDDTCHTCGKTYTWHLENDSIHPFNSGQAGATAFLTQRGRRGDNRPQRGLARPSQAYPFDPVLRQALIDKGVLTVEDLQVAEEKIRMVTAQFMGGSAWSATRGASTDSSTETGNPSIEPSFEKESQSE